MSLWSMRPSLTFYRLLKPTTTLPTTTWGYMLPIWSSAIRRQLISFLPSRSTVAPSNGHFLHHRPAPNQLPSKSRGLHHLFRSFLHRHMPRTISRLCHMISLLFHQCLNGIYLPPDRLAWLIPTYHDYQLRRRNLR